jgi:hypothetical protein
LASIQVKKVMTGFQKYALLLIKATGVATFPLTILILAAPQPLIAQTDLTTNEQLLNQG